MKPITKLATIMAPLALLLPTGAAGETQQLVGAVGKGDANVITLQNAAGERVSRLDPGTYSLLVHDFSTFHNFHLVGSGVDVDSGVGFVGDKTFTITVTDGTYSYVCDEHSDMTGRFTVGNAPPAPAPTPTPTPPTSTTKSLSAGVTAGGALTLSKKSVAAGTYRITVRDSSKTKNFHLVGTGVNKKTTKAFVGTVTWTVTFRAGKYRYGSDPKLTKTLLVT
jgi:plastocyanin